MKSRETTKLHKKTCRQLAPSLGVCIFHAEDRRPRVFGDRFSVLTLLDSLNIVSSLNCLIQLIKTPVNQLLRAVKWINKTVNHG